MTDDYSFQATAAGKGAGTIEIKAAQPDPSLPVILGRGQPAPQWVEKHAQAGWAQRYAALAEERDRLRALVEAAYREGWNDNTQNYDGDVDADWRHSDAREALEAT